MAYKDKSEQGNRDFGMMIKAPSFGGALVRPVWGKRVKEWTLFRPTGPLNKDRTDFMPWRNSGAEGDIGIGGNLDWFYKEDVFDGGTANRVTFLAASLDENGNVVDNEAQPSIAHDFVRLVRRAVKDTLDENKLFKGSNERPAPMKTPKTYGFVQGMLVAHGTKDYSDSPKFPCILMLTQSARIAMWKALEEENPEFSGDPDDIANRFLSGDVLTAAGGKMLAFSSNAAEAVGGVAKKVSFGGGVPAKNKGATDDPEEFKKYICEVRDQGFEDLPRDANGRLLIPEASLFTPWNKVLHYLTAEEMIKQLVRAYQDMPHILIAGLGHIPDALPESITKGKSIHPGKGPAAADAPAAPAVQVAAPAAKARPVASTVAPKFAPIANVAEVEGGEAEEQLEGAESPGAQGGIPGMSAEQIAALPPNIRETMMKLYSEGAPQQ